MTVSVNVVVAEIALVAADNVVPETLEEVISEPGEMLNVQPLQTVPVKVVVPPGLIGLVPLTLKAMLLAGSGATFTVKVADVVAGPKVTVSV